MKKYLIFIIALVIILASAITSYFLLYQKRIDSPTSTTQNPISPADTSTQEPTISDPETKAFKPVSLFANPVADFKARVTKKPFGIYITPQNSPVQPERFSGYHNAIDIEYQDVEADVPVFAIADSSVVLSRTAFGYGGVFVISFDLNGAKHTALFGHIRPSSLPKVGQTFKKGDQIALLGTGYSTETDGERRHLHFAVLANDNLNIKGYVQNESELVSWIDPLTLYN